MAGKSTISITFKLDGDASSFKDLTSSAEGLKKALTSTVSEAEQLKGNLVNFAALAAGLDAAQRSFSQLQAGMQDLADAYAVQETAEVKLSTVMQQRMNATDEEIESIKRLAAEQQKLGVIGDEVQLSGAQQVATFLNEKSSLDALLPAMNNLLAQQKGLNATTQDAVSVANLMGKAMQGQTSALTRVGITFSDAEAEVMKFGTESERAAMLAQIITNNVGDMNAQLAATDSGRQKQLANALGDIKEQLGSIVSGAMPFVTITSQSLTALTSITTLTKGFKTLSASIKAATAASATLKVAIKGLMIASGVGVAIAALTTVIEKLASRSGEAAGELESLKSAADVFQTTAASTKGEIDREIKSLDDLIKSNQDTTAAVRHLNEVYGAAFGTYNTASEWYDILTQKSSAYAKQVGYEAQARQLAISIAEKELALEKNKEKQQNLIDTGQATRTAGWQKGANVETKTVDSKPMREAKKEAAALEEELATLEAELGMVQNKMDGYAQSAQSAVSSLNSESVAVRELAKEYNNLQTAQREALGLEKIDTPEIFKPGAVSDQADEWQNLAGSINNATSDAGDTGRGFGSAANAIRAMGDAFKAAGDLDMPAFDIAGTIAQAVANIALGFGQADAESSSMGPWGWLAFTATGLAAMLATIAQIKSATAFAEGGVVSGPTLAMVGEYSGAANNPEVIAPLNKLREMLDANNGADLSNLEFVIKGRRLVAVLNKENKHRSRS